MPEPKKPPGGRKHALSDSASASCSIKGMCHKRWLSEISKPVGDDQNAGICEQRLNDAGRPVVAAGKALVAEEPGVDVLHDGADGAEPAAVVHAFVPDYGSDALAQAEPAVIGAVIAGIGHETGDRDASDQGKAQQFREHGRVVYVRGRGHRAKGEPLGRDDDVVLGSPLASVGRVRAGQIAAVLGADAATVDNDVQVPGGSFGAGPSHTEQYGMHSWQQGDITPL